MKVEYQKLLKRGLLLLLLVVIVQFIALRIADIGKEAGGYYAYFSIQNSGREIFYTIFLLIALPSLLLMFYYDSIHNKHANWCILRIGYQAYYKKACKQIFFSAMLFRLMIEILCILQVHFLFISFDFSSAVDTHLMFGANPVTNVIFYLITASIGTGIFCCFWFSLIYFIKNKYAFRGFIILWYIISLFVFTMLYSLLISFLTDSDQLKSIASGVSTITLLSPGTMYESYGFINFISGFVVYTITTFVLLRFSYKGKRYNG